MDEQAKEVAKRNAYKPEKVFIKYLTACGWTETEIREMWKYAEKAKKEVNENDKRRSS